MDLFIPSVMYATTPEETQPPSQLGAVFSNIGLGTIEDLALRSTQAEFTSHYEISDLETKSGTSMTQLPVSLNPNVGDIQPLSTTQIVSLLSIHSVYTLDMGNYT
jgi:hypothetical protein